MPEQIRISLSAERGIYPGLDGRGRAPEGYAYSLRDWQPTPLGLRPRSAWHATALTGAPTTRRGRGLYLGFRNNGLRKPLVATWEGGSQSGTGANLKIYSVPTTFVDYEPQEWTGALALLETITISDADYSLQPVVFAAGSNVVVYANPGFPNGRLHKWDGTTVTEIATDSIAGRALAFHKGRFFSAGAPGEQSRLRWSEEDDEDTWNVTTNFVKVKSQEGDPIECLLAWEGLLIIGKRSSMHYLYGSGPSSFALREITDEVGCAGGQYAMAATKQGIVWVGSDANVYRWNGGGRPVKMPTHYRGLDTLVYPYEGTTRQMPRQPASVVVVDDVVRALGPGILTSDIPPNLVFCWDLEAGTNWTESHGAMYQMCAAGGEYLIRTPYSSTTQALLSYRHIPWFRQYGSTDPRPDPWGISYDWTTGVISPAPLNGRATLRNVYIGYRKYGTLSGGNGLTFQATALDADGLVTATNEYVLGLDLPSGNLQRIWRRLDLSLQGNGFQFYFSSAPTNDTNLETYQIDEVYADFVADPDRR